MSPTVSLARPMPSRPAAGAGSPSEGFSVSPAARREHELFIGWRAGDTRAGAVLLERLRSQLMRFFRSLPGDQAEDLTQETLMVCVRARDSLRDVRCLRRYIYTVARRVLYRERSRSVAAELELDEGAIPDEMECWLNTERLDVERLLSTDSIPHTQVVAEYYITGLRAREIADRRQVPEGTVRSQIRRGLLYLRRSVEQAA